MANEATGERVFGIDLDDFDLPISVRAVDPATGALGEYVKTNRALLGDYGIDEHPLSPNQIAGSSESRIDAVDAWVVQHRTGRSVDIERRGTGTMVSLRKQPVVREGRVVAVLTICTQISELDVTAAIRADWTEQLLEIATLDRTDLAIERVFAVGCALLGLPMGTLAELHQDHVTLRTNEAAGPSPERLTVSPNFVEALMGRKVLLFRDLSVIAEPGPIITALELEAMASIPVIVDGKPWGLLAFSDREVRPQRFPDKTVPLLEALGATLANMIERDVARAKLVPVELLQRSNRELEEYAYAAAHDLRSPLRAMRSFAQLLAGELGERAPDLERSVDYADRVMEGADRMEQLLSSMLEHATAIEPDAAGAEPVDLNRVLGDAMMNLEAVIAETAATVEIASLPTVHGEYDQLVRVFSNLIENAIKYRHPDRRSEVRVFPSGPADSEIRVGDNGVGIPVDQHEKIFGLFKRLVEDDEGTGVGLSVVRRIVEDHDATITVEQPGPTGSEFVIKFPEQRLV